MKLISLIVLGFAMSCGSTTKKSDPIISSDPIETNEEVELVTASSEIEPTLPLGAVSGNFDGLNSPFYAYVLPSEGNKTTISFENPDVNPISIPETYGAKLYDLKLDRFDRDLLLVAAQTKDPIFIKYHLYTYKNNQWKSIITPFTLHVSHTKNDFIPVATHSENPNLITRHYSVFDLDQESEAGYTWRLLVEDVEILNK